MYVERVRIGAQCPSLRLHKDNKPDSSSTQAGVAFRGARACYRFLECGQGCRSNGWLVTFDPGEEAPVMQVPG